MSKDRIVKSKERIEILFRHSWDGVYEIFIMYYGHLKVLDQVRRRRILRHFVVSYGRHFKRRVGKMSSYVSNLDIYVNEAANNFCFDDEGTQLYPYYHVSHIGTVTRDSSSYEKFRSTVMSFLDKGIADGCTVGNIP